MTKATQFSIVFLITICQLLVVVLGQDFDISKIPGLSTKTTTGPCQPSKKEGFVGDDDNPQIYYRCTWNSSTNSFDIYSFICPGDQRFNGNPIQGGCLSPDEDPSSHNNYTCLRQNLENDAAKTCYEETISALEEELDVFIDAAAYRGNPSRNFHLSVKDIHLNMRSNYAALIQNTGQNIFPLIVATDNDTPELAGVGGAYKVYFRNGTMRRIVPVSADFELHKCLSHMVLGVFSIIAPYFRAPNSINWQPALKTFEQEVKEALYALPSSSLPPKEEAHAKKLLQMVASFISTSLKQNSVTALKFHKFASDMAPLIDKSMQIAAKAHVSATIPALKQLKKEMGEVEWKKTYVLIPTVWPVSMYNIRLQMFRKVMDFRQIKQQVLITEGARGEDDARTTLGRIVADRALAQLVFGGVKDESARDHLFSLSTRRDLLSSVEEEAIDKWCGGEDDWTILKTPQKGGGDDESRCPMTKHFATMLRQSP